MADTPAPATTGTDTLSRLTNRPVRTAEFTRPLDPNDAGVVGKARKAHTSAQAHHSALEAKGASLDALAKASEAIDVALAAYEAAQTDVAMFTVTVVAVPPYRVEEIMRAHPATTAQKTAARAAAKGDPNAEPAWNTDTFPAALVAAGVSTISISDGASDPITSVTAEAVADMWRLWPDQDQLSLFSLVQNVSQAGSNVDADLGKG